MKAEFWEALDNYWKTIGNDWESDDTQELLDRLRAAKKAAERQIEYVYYLQHVCVRKLTKDYFKK